MAANYFLRLDGITGESTDTQYPGDLQLYDWSWGGAQSAGTAAGNAGKTNFSNLSFTYVMDSSIPPLITTLAAGKHIATASLYGRNAQSKIPFITFQFGQVIVTGLQLQASGGGDDRPTVNISLGFASFQLIYTPLSPSGVQGTPIEAGWDLNKNTFL